MSRDQDGKVSASFQNDWSKNATGRWVWLNGGYCNVFVFCQQDYDNKKTLYFYSAISAVRFMRFAVLACYVFTVQGDKHVFCFILYVQFIILSVILNA